MAEHFDYQGVKDTMDQRISGSNERSVKMFNEGAQEIEQAMGATAGAALTGAAGATAKNTWTTLTEEYQKFSNYISDLVEQADALGKQVDETETEIQTNLTNVDDKTSGIA